MTSEAGLPISQFMAYVRRCGVEVKTYAELYRWSTESMGDFWSCVWDFLGIQGDKSDVHKRLDSVEHGKFFIGSTLNFAYNILCDAKRQGLRFVGSDGHEWSLGIPVMRQKVASIQAYLRQCGVTVGDHVAAYMPNTPESILAMLAVTAMGGVWVCAGWELGADTVVTRFAEVRPTVLITSCDAQHQMDPKVVSVVQRLQRDIDSIGHTLVLPHANRLVHGDAPGQVVLDQEGVGEDINYVTLPFDHPLYVVFSSGTTGKPKCIVHRAGGVLLQHAKEHILHCSLGPEDRAMFYSTCSWMMWHWSVGMLFTGAQVVLSDIPLLSQNGRALLDMVNRESLSFFGASASYYEWIVRLSQQCSLPSLRCVASTGSVLLADVAQAMEERLFPNARVYSISGGTDLLSCFVIGNPLTPIVPGVIQGAGLGMDVAVVDSSGRIVEGQKGDLVCRRPFPSRPLQFLNDESGARYHDAYFAHFDGFWRQGDWAMQHADGSFVLYGRSDTVLNPGGVRVGTAEIYALLNGFSWLKESLVTTIISKGKERLILLVVMADGEALTDQREAVIRQHLKVQGAAHFVPAYIHQLEGLPRTHNGKLSEKAAQSILHGGSVEHDLRDPAVLGEIQSIYQRYA